MNPLRRVKALRLAAAIRRWRPPGGVRVLSISLDALRFRGMAVRLRAESARHFVQRDEVFSVPRDDPSGVGETLDEVASDMTAILAERDAEPAEEAPAPSSPALPEPSKNGAAGLFSPSNN